MAFFTFLPAIGEVIAIALGFMRSNTWLTIVSMFVGKLDTLYTFSCMCSKVPGMLWQGEIFFKY